MQWIKCSDKLPDSYDAHEKHFRLDGKKSTGILVEEDGKTVFEYKHNAKGYITVPDLSRVEWLDESPTIADASVLVKALKPFADMFGELTEQKVQQGGVVFKYNHCEITVFDLLNASAALSKYNALPGSQGGEEQSIIDKCETAVGVLRTMLNKLKMPIGVDAADSILKQIKGYKVMNPKEDTGPQSMPLPIQEPLQSPSSIEESGLKEGEGLHDIVKTENELLSKCLNMLRYLYMNEYCGDHGPEVFELIRAK